MTLTADECRMFGLDMNVKGTNETVKLFGGIALGDGDPSGMQKIFTEEGITSSWNLFQQLKLPPKITKPAAPVIRKQKKEDEFFVIDLDLEMEMGDLLKRKLKPNLSSRKKAIQGVTNEEFSRLLLEKNYNFPLSRY